MYKFLIGELFDMEQVTDVNLTVEQYTNILTSIDNLLFEYRMEDISTVQLLGNGNIQINIHRSNTPTCFYIDVRNIEKQYVAKIDVIENC